jgi:hypothetical protein
MCVPGQVEEGDEYVIVDSDDEYGFVESDDVSDRGLACDAGWYADRLRAQLVGGRKVDYWLSLSVAFGAELSCLQLICQHQHEPHCRDWMGSCAAKKGNTHQKG